LKNKERMVKIIKKLKYNTLIKEFEGKKKMMNVKL
jgi:hypothetical protein